MLCLVFYYFIKKPIGNKQSGKTKNRERWAKKRRKRTLLKKPLLEIIANKKTQGSETNV